MAIEIFKDSNIVDVCVAAARKENIDSNVAEEANKLIRELAATPNPHNRYQIAQLVGFAVNEITRPQLTWLNQVADVKNVAFGDKAQFKTRLEGIRAFVQAKGATTPRSKVANKTVSIETIDVSARPVVNRVELQNGLVNMADLINDASYQMELKYNAYVQNALATAAATWAAPYYGTGVGLVKATLDPMIYHWMRMGGKASILGDIGELAKLAELTGFNAAAGTLQFSPEIINEQNAAGFIGTYVGSNVMQLVNPPIDGTDTPTYSTKDLYILPTAADASMRPLKVVFEGDLQSMDAENIDDLTYEVRLDQYFGVGVAYGDRPYMGVYHDSTP